MISTASLPDAARLTLDDLQAMQLRRNPFLGRGAGLRAGDGWHRSRRHGGGDELDSVGPWQSGDDLRHIDWHATARTGHPQVRRMLMQAHRPMLLLVDLRAHLFFGVHDALLARTACLAAAALAWRLQRDRQPLSLHAVGLQARQSDAMQSTAADRAPVTARPGMRARLIGLARLADQYAVGLQSSNDADPPAPTQPLDRVISAAMASWPTSGDIVLISDFSDPGESFADILALRPYASVHAISIEDTAIRHGFKVGWYPAFVGVGGRFQNVSIAPLGNAEISGRVSAWHERLTDQLQSAGLTSVMRCDLEDLASGQLR